MEGKSGTTEKGKGAEWQEEGERRNWKSYQRESEKTTHQMINIVTCLSFYDSKDLYRCLAFSVNSPCECFANQIEVYTRYIKVVLLVAGTWTEKKNVARWIFLFRHMILCTLRIQNTKVRWWEGFEKMEFSSLFLMRKRLSSGQGWFLSPHFPLIGGIFVFRSGLRFSFRAPRVRKRSFSLSKMTSSMNVK